jgi:O-antigen/teichoic acid export membrane protein
MIVGAGLRPLLGAQFSLDQLAVYSLCFRLCAPCMLIHQLVGTAFFARLYRTSDRNFDLVVVGMIAACTLCVAALWLALRPLIGVAFPTYITHIAMLTPLFPLVGLQVTLWIVNALLEMKMGRHEVAHRAAVLGYVVFGAFLAIFALGAAGTMARVTLLFDAALLIFALGQVVLLYRRNVRLPLAACAAPVATAACVLMSLAS